MDYEFKMPDPGEGIHEAEIVDVLVSEGDTVEEEDSVLVIETDKATNEIPSPVSGEVKKINVAIDDTVKVGDVLMVFDVAEEEAEKAEAEPEAEPEDEEETEEEEAPSGGREEAETKTEEAPEKKKKAAAKKAEKPEKKKADTDRDRPVPAAPSTRRLARELGVDLHEVPASGPGGRVLAEDVKAFAEEGKKAPEKEEKKAAEKEKPEKAAPEKPEKKAPAEAPELPDFTQWGPVERRPLKSIRRATARRMAQSWAEIPHVVHQDEADITELEAFRQERKVDIEEKGGALTLTIFALKAAVAALKEHPRLNASLDMAAREIIIKHHYHIGVAVDTDRGLLVPVVRDVDRKSILDLARELPELARRTREGEVGLEEMSGGTFTITNIGPIGGTAFSPIINYPQCAILGLAKGALKPVIRKTAGGGHKTEPRLMLPIMLGFDHRLADGADAARFVNRIVDGFRSPEHLMMVM
jgi:pyruvate dehydrogenase E2 component (dihydrolipoamide acetyltransferase)